MACEQFGMSEGVNRILDIHNYHVFVCEIDEKAVFAIKETGGPCF